VVWVIFGLEYYLTSKEVNAKILEIKKNGKKFPHFSVLQNNNQLTSETHFRYTLYVRIYIYTDIFCNIRPYHICTVVVFFFCSQTVQFTVLWILFLSIVLGNGAVLIALSFNKARKNRMNFFIMHLALAGE